MAIRHRLRNNGMIDHLGFDCTDYLRSRAFYERALTPLGLGVGMAFGAGQCDDCRQPADRAVDLRMPA